MDKKMKIYNKPVIREPIEMEIEEQVESLVEETTDDIFEIKDGIVVNCTSVYVRSGSHSNASPIDILEAGKKVSAIGEENNFYKVLTEDNLEGFVMKDYLKLI